MLLHLLVDPVPFDACFPTKDSTSLHGQVHHRSVCLVGTVDLGRRQSSYQKWSRIKENSTWWKRSELGVVERVKQRSGTLLDTCSQYP